MSAPRVLGVARSYLGTVERPANSNRTKFGAAYGMDGYAWCAMFVWYVMREAGLSHLIPKTAYTPTFANWFKQRGQWGTVPRPGAIVFFDFPGDGVNRISHVGIVEAVNRDGSVICIEGNTSPGTGGSQRDGGGVWRRTRRTGIVGYGYPAYAASSPAAPPVPSPAREDDLMSPVLIRFYDDNWKLDPNGLNYRGASPAEAGGNSGSIAEAFVRWVAHWGSATCRVVAWDGKRPIGENKDAVAAGLDYWKLPDNVVRSFTVEGRRQNAGVEVGISLITVPKR